MKRRKRSISIFMMLAKIMPPNTNLAISIKNFPISASIAYFLSFSIIYRYVVLTKIRNKSRKRKTECFVFSISVFYALICVADTETQSFIFNVTAGFVLSINFSVFPCLCVLFLLTPRLCVSAFVLRCTIRDNGRKHGCCGLPCTRGHGTPG